MKQLRIFLGVLIVIGLVLLATQKIWVPKLVDRIIQSEQKKNPTKTGGDSSNSSPITYSNASADLIKVSLPFPGAVTGKEFSVTGTARGTWYFEASFPIQVLDKDGKILASTPAHAEGEWMTENFVSFKADIVIPQTYAGPATVVLQKDNPSGLPEHDASMSFPITIEY